MSDYSQIKLEGLYAHSKCKSNIEKEYNLLNDTYNHLINLGIPLTIKHFADSAAFLYNPDLSKDGMRIGILLYGVLPVGITESESSDLELCPVMSVKTYIMQIHNIENSETLGYYSDSKIDKNSRIAVIPLGYGKGLDRKSVAAGIHVLINGQRVPLCGDIFMNTSYVDVPQFRNVVWAMRLY